MINCFIRCIVRIKVTKNILKPAEIMLDDLRVPIGRFIVPESGIKHPTFSCFLAPGGGILTFQIERNVGGFGLARLPVCFGRDCFDFTVIVMGVLPR